VDDDRNEEVVGPRVEPAEDERESEDPGQREVDCRRGGRVGVERRDVREGEGDAREEHRPRLEVRSYSDAWTAPR